MGGRASSPLRDHVIFVEGAPRSGTSWLVTLLATHPDIAGVEAESHLFDFGVDRLFDNLEYRDPLFHGLDSYLDRDELVDLARDLADGVLMAMRSHVSAGTTPAYVVEKTPVASEIGGRDLARKRECYPDAWYVHIVRDREEVARSLMRAPWMADRSYAACAGLWDRTVGYARTELGDLERYREVRYEDLRSDPAAACKELFEWLGVESAEDVLETVRVLSRDPYSDLGTVVTPEPSARSTAAALSRRLVAHAQGLITRRPKSDAPERGAPPGGHLAFTFVRALRERDGSTLRSLTVPSFELIYRSAGDDRSLRGDDARDALVAIANETFRGRYVGEWWASAGGGPGEWWTSAAGTPFWTIFFSALRGDATRVDFAIGLVLEDDGLVRRAVTISAGPLGGRPVGLSPDAAESQT
jgi:hypothetical protein